jgi:hypothetical protein
MVHSEKSEFIISQLADPCIMKGELVTNQRTLVSPLPSFQRFLLYREGSAMTGLLQKAVQGNYSGSDSSPDKYDSRRTYYP